MYQWLLAFHIIAVIAWMAGMLYLPRLFVYHCEADPGSRQSETFKVMERRLLRAIMNPAMIVTWLLGLWLAPRGGWVAGPWVRIKVALARGLVPPAWAAKEVRVGSGVARRPGVFGRLREGFPRRPPPKAAEIL